MKLDILSAAISVALAYPHKHDTALIVRPDWSRREAVHTARDGVRRTDLMKWRPSVDETDNYVSAGAL